MGGGGVFTQVFLLFEAVPTFAGELAVVLAAALVVADHAHDVLPVLVLGAAALVVGALLADVITGREGGDCGAEPRTVKIF